MPGDLDLSFGGTGIVLTGFGSPANNEGAGAVTIQRNGRIVVAGYSNPNGNSDFALVGLTTLGELDSTFGTSGNGKVHTNFGGDDSAGAIAIQKSKKIVVAGTSNANGSYDFALARYTKDGAIDATFGAGGTVLTDFGGDDQACGLAIETGDRIVVVGTSDANGSNDFALARYTKDGVLDPSFGVGGKVLTDFGADDEAAAIALQSGKIVAAGSHATTDGNADFALARYEQNGALDTTFGPDGTGRILTDLGSSRKNEATALAVQPDGKIVVVGLSKAVGESSFHFAVARYKKNGNPDTTFGLNGAGFVTTDFQSSSTDMPKAVAIQPDGKIVVAGVTATDGADNLTYDFALARYKSSGKLNTGFGTGGTVTTDLGQSSFDYALGVAVQQDGNIVVVGWTSNSADGSDSLIAVARFLG